MEKQFKSDSMNTMLATLKAAYPRCLRECDIWEPVMQQEGIPASARNNRRGGTHLRTLVRKNLAKRLSTGYYSYIPQVGD